MLDIVFLLLVFFIVTQTFEDDEPIFPSIFLQQRLPSPVKMCPMKLS